MIFKSEIDSACVNNCKTVHKYRLEGKCCERSNQQCQSSLLYFECMASTTRK